MASWENLDFSPIAKLPQVRREAVMQSNRERTLADLASGSIDQTAAAQRLIAGGDMQGGLSLAQLANNNRDFQFRGQEAARAQSNADRAFNFQQQQATEAARGYETREVDDGHGGKMLVRTHKQTGATERVPIAGQDTTPQNPFSQGRMNESQSKDALYTSRMLSAEKILQDPKVTEAALSLKQRGMSAVPVAGNYMVSREFQLFDQAQRNFINATLRRESGAVISEAEFENARKQYFPQPGDTPERLTQKRDNRADAIKGIGSGAGPGYRPENVLGPKGEVVPNPVPQRAAQQPKLGGKPISQAEYQALPSGATYTAPDGSTRTKR